MQPISKRKYKLIVWRTKRVYVKAYLVSNDIAHQEFTHRLTSRFYLWLTDRDWEDLRAYVQSIAWHGLSGADIER